MDHEGTRDLRELRLLNESQIKPVLQSAPGVAEVASVGGLEKQYQIKLFPPLADRARHLPPADHPRSSKARSRKPADARSRSPTANISFAASLKVDDLDKLAFLVLGRDKEGGPVQLKDVGYMQSGYDLRRGIADLDGTGEVVGGIAIMEQGRNVLAVTNALRSKLEQLKPTLPAGIELVPTYDRSALIWETLKNFVQALGYELIVVILVIGVALRERAGVRGADLRAASWHVVHRAAALGVRPDRQSLLARRSGDCDRRDGRRDDRDRRELHVRLAQRGAVSGREKMAIIIDATATMTRPLLFSMLIIVTSFLPIFFLGEREGRLFNPLAYSKTFAMAFSTLLTLFLLPVVIVWVFKRDVVPPDVRESVFVRGYRAALLWMIRHRYAFVGASAVDPRARNDGHAPVPEGLHAGDGRGLDPLHADDAAGPAVTRSGMDRPADGPQAEGLPRSRARVRQARTRGYRDRSGAGGDGRDHRHAQAASLSGGRA